MSGDRPTATAQPGRSAVPGPRHAAARPRRGGFVARAFGVTAVLSAAGSGLGLLRDLLLARYFGANQGTDAFLVAWTVPETAAPLLIEDAMAFLMVPAFSLALVLREEHPHGPDPVRQLVRATLPRLLLALCTLTLAAAVGAGPLVGLLAPGLADPALAVTCTRITALTVLPFGVVGYLCSMLRAHHRFTAPACIYVAYNLGILAVLLGGHALLGVRSAALGVTCGSLLMAGLLLAAARRLHGTRRTGRPARGASDGGLLLIPLAMLPVAAFTLTRQAQVFVERFLGSGLPPGTISHLNYAAKVSQLAMTAGILIVTVTFPLVARALAAGDLAAARDRVEKDLGQAAAVVLLGTAFLMACAPSVVALLFQRGAFGPHDTTATAEVIRVYSFGLPAQALIGVMVRPFFSLRPVVRRAGDPQPAGSRLRPLDWYPVAAMAVGLLVTAGVGLAATPRYGALGLAAGNAAGITTAAVLLLRGLLLRGIALRLRRVLGGQARLLAAAVGAAAAGTAAASGPSAPLPATLLGGLTVALVFAGLGTALGAPEVRDPVRALLRAAGPVTQAAERKPHGR
ncbi:lipid II flippase MurJ [Kitasatospora sp. DSM 101779]|uniref:lipid II flippase MurJ n=1 Tax=Kitasatospora sp. DSM 101779 TaxID=2853165 RepID=UPI0021D87864|nr:lipid II flippase MurJ [Kitasatospora sp. DSM 101779]MCU7822301.1 virulence factor MviN [Kitasatospora sp. DSM 101779]